MNTFKWAAVKQRFIQLKRIDVLQHMLLNCIDPLMTYNIHQTVSSVYKQICGLFFCSAY